jgi:uncharacterized repeat protein (TIGR04138 family)
MSEPDGLITLDELAKQSGKYPVDAFNFVREGLKFTVQKIHQNCQEEKHISGQDLCWGLRDYAIKRWGLLAPAVLQRWNITTTMDFGRIVFAMVNAGWMAKKDEDDVDDFSDVYDFRSAFDTGLAIDLEKKGKSDSEL